MGVVSTGSLSECVIEFVIRYLLCVVKGMLLGVISGKGCQL